jgi:hypothetical protein
MNILPYYGGMKKTFNINQPTQNPAYNTNINESPKNNNSDYKAFSKGMKKLGGKSMKGKGRTGGKAHKKKLTKKKISKILKI